ncbi:MAG: flagellar biosynthesis anti-sigma factor FlgM [Aeromonas sp.]
MKITRTEVPFIQPQAARKTETAKAESPVAVAAPLAEASTISSTAQSIAQARTQLASTSDVDMDRVNEIRSAISEGRLNLDMDALSQAILDMHRR